MAFSVSQLRSLTLSSFFVVLFFSACERSSIDSRRDALRLTSPPTLEDDLSLKGIDQGIQSTLAQLEKNKSKTIRFGAIESDVGDYSEKLRQLLGSLKNSEPESQVFKKVLELFDFHEVYGNKGWGDILLTSYFEPVIRGSKKRTKNFSRALYSPPKDMIEVPTHRFSKKIKKRRTLVGRFSKRNRRSKRGNRVLLPYYTREEIDSKGMLSGRGLEIVWVDPIDAFFLQIQGSGTIELKDGSFIRVGFIDGVLKQNGHDYYAIGRALTDHIPIKEMTLEKIESHLRSLPASGAQEILNRNPSYVFYDELDSKPITYFGTPVVAGRTIATDRKFFSKGALGYLVFEKPVFEGGELKWVKVGRFVFDHDIGGAIKGPGRADLFYGRGDEAKRAAGEIKHQAKLYYLVPKQSTK